MSDWKKHMAENDAYAQGLAKKPHKTFKVNPYVLVFEDEAHGNVKHFYFDAHQKGASAWMHLIEGEDRALLIDTAFGIGDLKGLVREITDKPLDVVVTHFHGDRSLGSGQFDRVHCHKFAAPYYPEYLTISAFRDALRAFLPRLGEVSGLYPGHGILGAKPSILKDMLDCCESIIAAPEDFEHYDYVPDPDQDRIKCVGRAMVVYSPDRVSAS